MIFYRIYYFEAREEMKMGDFVTIPSDFKIYKTSYGEFPDGVVAPSACENSYVSGDRVPIYLILKEEVKVI